MLITENFNVKVDIKINDILESDKINFNISTKNEMINRIVSYYLKFEITGIEEEIKKSLKNRIGSIKTKLEIANIIEIIYELKKAEVNKEKEYFQLNFRLNKDTFKDYEDYILDLEEEKINITKFFREIFEWYCNKKQYEREKILYYKTIESIEKQLLEKNLRKRSLKISIKTLENKPVEIVPLGIVTSKNENYSYLLGYSEIIDKVTLKETGKFAIFPTRISNIINLKEGKRFEIVDDEKIDNPSLYLVGKSTIAKANEMINNRVVSYGEENKIKLALTSEGKKRLEIILHNRPFNLNKICNLNEAGCKVKEDDERAVIYEKQICEGEEKHIYTFNSTYFAVKAYFLSFGKECTILEPEKLRDEFKEHYLQAIENYNKN